MVEHTIRIDNEVWERLAQRQARLSAAAGRHVSVSETVQALIGEDEPAYDGCECTRESNPACPAREHAQPHGVLASWLVEDATDPEGEIAVCGECRPANLEAVWIEGVVACECSPGVNPGCELGSHEEGHLVPAQWRVSEPEDADEFMYLCNNCTGAATARRGLDGYVFEVLEQAGGQA